MLLFTPEASLAERVTQRSGVCPCLSAVYGYFYECDASTPPAYVAALLSEGRYSSYEWNYSDGAMSAVHTVTVTLVFVAVRTSLMALINSF